MRSEFSDQPSQTYWVKVRNPRTNADNFLYHVDIDFHFCTMLVAMSLPPGEQPRYTPLKHFYWNILWEAHFTMDASGSPNERATRVRHLEVNVQRQVRSDAPNDPRFVRRLEDRSLPISNELATHLPAVRLGTSWSDRSLGAFLPDRAVQDLFWPPR
jgi:hypothetical protein